MVGDKLVKNLYRDCLRLVNHVAGNTKKGDILRLNVRTSFKQNIMLTDPVKIEEAKEAARRSLTNYLTLYSLSRLKKSGGDQ